MEQVPFYGDERQLAACIYCGAETETRDHVPCKVLLDNEPQYPANLPCVPACLDCNNNASADEEYVACLVECAVAGSTEPDKIRRRKIRRILEDSPGLRTRLANAQQVTESGSIITAEVNRVRNVVVKLARGHACFELSELMRDEPTRCGFKPLDAMTDSEREAFETVPQAEVWPEVGSRSMILIAEGEAYGDWVTVQEGRYRYMTALDDGLLVRMVIGEYLACEVFWE